MARLDQRLRLFRDREARSEPVAVRPGSFEEIVEGYQGRHAADRVIEDEPPRHATPESLEALSRLEAGAPEPAASEGTRTEVAKPVEPAAPEKPSGRTATAEPRTWTPVPVPLPTYTLKQESPRPRHRALHAGGRRRGGEPGAGRPTSSAPSYGTVEREPEQAAQTFDLDSVLARRRAAGA